MCWKLIYKKRAHAAKRRRAGAIAAALLAMMLLAAMAAAQQPQGPPPPPRDHMGGGMGPGGSGGHGGPGGPGMGPGRGLGMGMGRGMGPGGPGGPMPQRAQELLEQVLLARISQDLELDDEQTVLLVKRFSEHREALHEQRQARGRLLQELRQQVETDAGEEAVVDTLEALQALDQEMLRAQQDFLENVGADFHPEQRARLYLFLDDFEQDMHRLVMQARRRAAGMGEGPRGIRQHDDGPPAAPRQAPGDELRGQD